MFQNSDSIVYIVSKAILHLRIQMEVRLSELEEDCQEELRHIIKAIQSQLRTGGQNDYFNKTLETVAATLPVSVIELARIPGMKDLVMNKWSADIILGIMQHYKQIRKKLTKKKENTKDFTTTITQSSSEVSKNQEYLFNSKCPFPNPKWSSKQQLMVGPMPLKLEVSALRSAFVSKGHVINVYNDSLRFTLPSSHPMSKFGQQTHVKFGYIVYSKPEDARNLLSEGYVMVGQAKVAVKEMDGKPAVVFKTAEERRKLAEERSRNKNKKVIDGKPAVVAFKTAEKIRKNNKKKAVDKYSFKPDCPLPDPRWPPEQQLMIGPIPAAMEHAELRPFFQSVGSLSHLFIFTHQHQHYHTLPALHPWRKQFNKVKFGYVVFRRPEVAMRLLARGYLMVGQLKVEVKEMDGKSAVVLLQRFGQHVRND